MHHAHGSDSHLHRRQRAVVSDAFSLVTSAAVQSTTTAAPVATETTPAAVTTTEVPVASSTTPAAVESTTTPAGELAQQQQQDCGGLRVFEGSEAGGAPRAGFSR